MANGSTQSLTVLIAADTYPPHVNGAATACFRLATELTSRGHDVHVVTPQIEWGPDSTEARDEATIHRLRSFKAPTHEYYRLVTKTHAKRAIGRLLDEIHPDVVHAQCHYMIGEAAINEAEKRRVRTISTNHFMPENLEPFLPFPQWFLNIVSKNSWKDMGRLMGKTAVVTTPTPLSARTMNKSANLEHILPVSNGIDAAKYELADGETVTPHEHPTVLFVGRLAVEKNVNELIEAIALSDPDLQLHAEIVGAGEQETKLKQLARGLGVADRVNFRGHISEAELREAYLRADVFCQPGTAELQSLVSLEAMSASTPVVLANALALPHLVNNGVNGYLFEPGNPADLADKLTRVLTASQEEQRLMGISSHERAAKHSQKTTMDIYEALYYGATFEEASSMISEAKLR